MEITAAIYKNEYKGDNPKAPDYSGPATVDGVEKRIAGWINKDKSGKSYISVKIEDKREASSSPTSDSLEKLDDSFFGDDDIAF